MISGSRFAAAHERRPVSDGNLHALDNWSRSRDAGLLQANFRSLVQNVADIETVQFVPIGAGARSISADGVVLAFT